jgi:type II secretory pathway pseudopilin PulG
MIEIAISLAIIGFALVAIIGILPAGMTVQKDNRHETIINQDLTVFLNALRNGDQGLDDLTNYVTAITNYSTLFNQQGAFVSSTAYGYTYASSSHNPPYPITNGFRIVGLLSTPRIAPGNGGYVSNHVVAFVRSLSGPVSEKFPQVDPAMQQFALSYRLICDISRYGTNYYSPDWTNYDTALFPSLTTNEVIARSNYMIMVRDFETNWHDLRLTFRWPILPNGSSGPNKQTFRTSVSGALLQTNEPGFLNAGPHCIIYFFEPRTYYKGT